MAYDVEGAVRQWIMGMGRSQNLPIEMPYDTFLKVGCLREQIRYDTLKHTSNS